MTSQAVDYVWRFGYGSNIGQEVLKQKKNLNPEKYYTGTIANYELYFTPGIPFVEPGWGATRYNEGSVLHGSAFYISQEEAQKLDAQEAGYNVLPCQFTSYCGKLIDNVGLYIPKKEFKSGDKEGIPSLRYLRLLQQGARDGNLEAHWIEKLDKQPYYKTPPEVRSQTLKWIKEFESNSERNGVYWTAEKLARHDGKDQKYPLTQALWNMSSRSTMHGFFRHGKGILSPVEICYNLEVKALIPMIFVMDKKDSVPYQNYTSALRKKENSYFKISSQFYTEEGKLLLD